MNLLVVKLERENSQTCIVDLSRLFLIGNLISPISVVTNQSLKIKVPWGLSKEPGRFLHSSSPQSIGLKMPLG